MFKLQQPNNSKNDVICHPKDQPKNSVDERRLYVERSGFPAYLMISVGVSKKGKTSLYFIEMGTRINSDYYQQEILQNMLPEMYRIAGGPLVFQQDRAKAQTAKSTVEFIENSKVIFD